MTLFEKVFCGIDGVEMVVWDVVPNVAMGMCAQGQAKMAVERIRVYVSRRLATVEEMNVLKTINEEVLS